MSFTLDLGSPVPNNPAMVGAGTSQRTAIPITKQLSIFSTVPSGSGAVLPPPSANASQLTIINNGANALLVYPSIGGTIGEGEVNEPYSLAPGGTVTFNSYSGEEVESADWVVQSSASVGVGLSNTGGELTAAPPVTQRAPGANDVAGYTAGQAIWMGQDGRFWQLNGTLNGESRWVPFASSGSTPGEVVAGGVALYGTRRIVSAYAGNLFKVTRLSDLTTLDIPATASGAPDLSALAAFLAADGGIGYVSTLYDQSGGTNDATQTVVASMPRVDLSAVQGNNIPLLFDNTKRGYDTGLRTYTATWPGSGADVTIATTYIASLLPGQIVTGTNIPVSTIASAINYSTGVVTLSNNPTGAPGALTFATPGVWLDIDNTAQVPWRNWSVAMTVAMPGMNAFAGRPAIFGVHGADAAAPAGSWAGIWFGGQNFTSLRLNNGNNLGGGNGFGTQAHSSPQVVAVSIGGATGRDLTWQINGKQGATTNFITAPPASTLSGGAIGFFNQPSAPANRNTGDFLLYDWMGFPTALTAAQMTSITAAVASARGFAPQVAHALVADGSSTTFGNGTTSPLCWPIQTAQHISYISPVLAYNAAAGGPIEVSYTYFPSYAGQVPNDVKNIVVFHPGLGNSLQAIGSLTVTNTDTVTGVLTISGSTVNTNFATGTHITGNVNLPAGAYTIASTSSTVTVDPDHKPLGNVGTITVVNDQANWAWSSLTDYGNAVLANGYRGWIMIGSASRGTFSAAQLAQFNTVKTFMRESWQSLPGCLGFVDLEADPYFGGDAPMTVTAINGKDVTVDAASTYALAASRVSWTGMPFDVTNNTGGQTITAVNGNVLTISNSTDGLYVGAQITAYNPAPWTTYPTIWQTDQQHFTPLGYAIQGATFSAYLQANNFLQ